MFKFTVWDISLNYDLVLKKRSMKYLKSGLFLIVEENGAEKLISLAIKQNSLKFLKYNVIENFKYLTAPLQCHHNLCS